MNERTTPGMAGLTPLLLLLILASNVWIGVTVQQGLDGGSPSPAAPSASAMPVPAAPGAAAPTPDANAQAANVKKPSKDDFVKGAKNATVSIIMYSDYECPFCGRAKPTMDQILQTYPDDVNLIHRDYPLAFHPKARPAAIAGRCVGKIGGSTAFWKFADAAYAKVSSDPTVLDTAGLAKLATDAGVSAAKYNDCVTKKETEAQVDTDVQEGSAAGVNGTPGFILINNKTGKVESVAGAQPVASFEAALGRLGVTK